MRMYYLVVVEFEVSFAENVLHPAAAEVAPGQQLEMANALRALKLAYQMVRLREHTDNAVHTDLTRLPTLHQLPLLFFLFRCMRPGLILARWQCLAPTLLLLRSSPLHLRAPPHPSASCRPRGGGLRLRRGRGDAGMKERRGVAVAEATRDGVAELRRLRPTGDRDP